MSKKIITISITLVVLLLAFPFFSVFASTPSPEEYNSALDKYATELEKRYYIEISYPIRSDKYAAIGTATLSTLDTTLGYLSSSFVRQLSKYYHANYGSRLTFQYSYLPEDFSKRDIAALGYFSSENAMVQLFIPTKNENMTMTGNSPITILHETGHAYHLFLSNKYGSDKLEDEWRSINEGYDYGYYKDNPDRSTYMSYYSTVSYEEDFAETFAYAFSFNRPGLGLSNRLYKNNKGLTPLGRKVKLLEKKLPLYIDNLHLAQKSLDNMYNAPTSLYYKGFYLSGNSLEYVGFNEPNGILPAVLASLKIDATSSEWLWDVGGWKVLDKNSGAYLVFPGCGYITLTIPKK